MSAKIGEYRASARGVALGAERLSKGPSDEAGVVIRNAIPEPLLKKPYVPINVAARLDGKAVRSLLNAN